MGWAGGLPLEEASGRAAGVYRLGQSADNGPATALVDRLSDNLQTDCAPEGGATAPGEVRRQGRQGRGERSRRQQEVISSDRCRRPRGSANSAVPQSPGHGIQCWAGTSTSPFARFRKALCRATHSSTRGPCDPSIFRTFPMPLPYPEAVGPGGGACETR